MKRTAVFLITSFILLTLYPALVTATDPLLGIKDVRVNDDDSFFDQGKPSWFTTEEGYIYLVWEDFRETYWSIFFSRSFDGGRTWGDGNGKNNNDVNVVDDPLGLYSHRDPSISITPDFTIYVFWQDSREGPWKIYYSFSENGGVNWSSSKPLGGPEGNQTEVSTGVVNGTIWVAWIQEVADGTGIYMTHLNSSGTPQEFFRVDRENTTKSGLFMTTSENEISLLWEETEDSKAIMWTTLREEALLNGMAGDVQELVAPPGEGYVSDPFASYDPYGNLLVAYEEENYGLLQVYYMVIYSDGIRAGPYRIRTPTLNVSYQADPSIVADSKGNIYFFWTEEEDVNHLIKGGWTSRVGEEATDVYVMDWTLMMGPRPTEPQYTYAMMDRGETSAFLVKDSPAVLWLDSRDDPNPSKPEPENYDIYFNRYPGKPNTPPEGTAVAVKNISWDRATLQWDRCMDLDFSSYVIYLSPFKNFNPGPSFEIARIGERNTTTFNITGLEMNTTYYVRIGVEDAGGLVNMSEEVEFTTTINGPPRITIISPKEEVTVDRQLEVLFSVFDPDNDAEVTLYLMGAGEQPPGRVVGQFQEGEVGLINFTLNTTSLSNGSYRLRVVASDGVNPPVTASFPLITVYHPPPEPPRLLNVLSVSPTPGSTNLPLRSLFRVVFSDELNPDTIGGETVLMSVGSSPIQPNLTIMDDGLTLLIDPGFLLPPRTDCSLTLLSDIESVDGAPLDGMGLGKPSSVTFTFRTGPDNGRPQVLNYTPEGVMISPQTKIIIEFSTWVDISTIEDGIKIVKAGGGEVSYTYNYDINLSRLVITPDSLEYSASYRVVITRDLLGRNGLPAEEFRWNFTTLPYSYAPDSDKDGYPDPIDAFPEDPEEWRDTDSDGIGDNRDKDDDGDGIPDKWEESHGLNPLLNDASDDTDGDGYTNYEEYRANTDPLDPASHPGGINWILWVAILIAVLALVLTVMVYLAKKKRREWPWE